MRMNELTSQFRRDYKRELEGPYRSALQGQKNELSATIELLARDEALPARCRDHGLVGAPRACLKHSVRPPGDGRHSAIRGTGPYSPGTGTGTGTAARVATPLAPAGSAGNSISA
ncbi:hypothetical protein E1J61_19295 [Cupriavidus sp. L7L]|nr:hypothetical protein E1J61_19295 [Cupriavidus sp. L7L]